LEVLKDDWNIEMTIVKDGMNICDYFEYQEEYQNPLSYMSNQIRFLFDVDLEKECKLQYKCLADFVPEELLNHVKTPCPRNMLAYTGMNLRDIEFYKMYFKVRGSITTPHQENLNLSLININFGPGSCTWFFISVEQFNKLEELLSKKKIKFSSMSWWPNLEELSESGIIFNEYDQKPGDMIFISPGTIHWAFSNGNCTHISWNLAPLNVRQYSMAIIKYDWNQINEVKSLLPMIDITFKIIKKAHLKPNEKLNVFMTKIFRKYVSYCEKTIKYLESNNRFFQLIETDNLVVKSDYTYYCIDCKCEIFNLIFVKKYKNIELSEIKCSKSIQGKDINDKTTCFDCAKKDLNLYNIYLQRSIGTLQLEINSFKFFSSFQSRSCFEIMDLSVNTCSNCKDFFLKNIQSKDYDPSEFCRFIDWRQNDKTFIQLNSIPNFYKSFYTHEYLEPFSFINKVSKKNATYILNKIYKPFKHLIAREKKMSERKINGGKSWKKPSIGFREKCDQCWTFIFNGHFCCQACAYLLCGDCHSNLTSNTKAISMFCTFEVLKISKFRGKKKFFSEKI
jgi:hypothetical protein